MHSAMFSICFIPTNVTYIDNNLILSTGMSGRIASPLGSMDRKHTKYEY